MQAEGCRALWFLILGGHEEAERRLVDAGARVALDSALQAFPNNHIIKEIVPSLAALKEKRQ